MREVAEGSTENTGKREGNGSEREETRDWGKDWERECSLTERRQDVCEDDKLKKLRLSGIEGRKYNEMKNRVGYAREKSENETEWKERYSKEDI